MTAPNHITGGIVITGIFCSLWNVNIFENPLNISLTIIGSLIPDIDHTKSIIGKLVYPLAKNISRKYGHRTITHSLLFLISITGITYILEHFHFFNFNDHSTSLILFFAVFSHLLLDMVTIQGIPLFYPFYKNPCVLPANVELRIKSGNLKQEGIVLFIFAFLTFFLQDLFYNGFWFNYNKQFKDLAHLERQFKLTNNLLEVTYDYNIFQKNYKGKGYLLYADYEQCFILGNTLINLNVFQQGQVIHNLTPIKKQTALILRKINFSNIKLDSINKIFDKKFISTGKIYSTQKIYLISNTEPKLDDYFEIKNKYNLQMKKGIRDTLNISTLKDTQNLEYKIKLEEDALFHSNNKYPTAKEKLNQLTSNLQTPPTSNYEINEIKNEIIKVEKYLNNFTPKKSKTLIKLKKQLKELKNLKPKYSINCSGSLSYFELPK